MIEVRNFIFSVSDFASTTGASMAWLLGSKYKGRAGTLRHSNMAVLLLPFDIERKVLTPTPSSTSPRMTDGETDARLLPLMLMLLLLPVLYRFALLSSLINFKGARSARGNPVGEYRAPPK